jgi:hypothetical protein
VVGLAETAVLVLGLATLAAGAAEVEVGFGAGRVAVLAFAAPVAEATVVATDPLATEVAAVLVGAWDGDGEPAELQATRASPATAIAPARTGR